MNGHHWVWLGSRADSILGLPKTLLPIYTLGADVVAYAQVDVEASARARSIAPPTTVIANAQESYTASVGLVYQMTPKVSLTAGGSIDYSTGAVHPRRHRVFRLFLSVRRKTYNLSTGLFVLHDAFPIGRAERLIFGRVSANLITPEDMVLVSLNYRPY